MSISTDKCLTFLYLYACTDVHINWYMSNLSVIICEYPCPYQLIHVWPFCTYMRVLMSTSTDTCLTFLYLYASIHVHINWYMSDLSVLICVYWCPHQLIHVRPFCTYMRVLMSISTDTCLTFLYLYASTRVHINWYMFDLSVLICVYWCPHQLIHVRPFCTYMRVLVSISTDTCLTFLYLYASTHVHINW